MGLRALSKRRAWQRADVRPPKISELWGVLPFARLQHSISKGEFMLQPPIYVHLSVRHTRSEDLDQKSSDNRNTKWKAEGSGSHFSSARAHPCGHMACARVRHKWEPAGAPSPPSHAESEPSKFKQHSVPNRNVNSGYTEVLGFWIMFFPFLCMPVGGWRG